MHCNICMRICMHKYITHKCVKAGIIYIYIYIIVYVKGLYICVCECMLCVCIPGYTQLLHAW